MQKRVFKKEDYVSFDSATNKSTCLLCKKVLCGFVIGNIKRHYEKVHDIKFQKKYAQHTVVVVEGKTNAADTSLATDADTTNGDRELRLNKCEFLKCCVGLVTVNNLPLRIFDDDEFFKKLISTYEDEFDLNLNSSNIIDSIDFWALRVKLCLKGKFKQKMLSLNIDVANRMKKNVMVINVKCIERYRFVTYTLAVVPLKSKQSAQVLKEEILKCLADFDIDLKQLYALTGDSRGCVMAALNLIQQESEDNQYENAMVTDEFDASSEDFKSTLSIIKCGYHTIKLVVREFFTSVESNLSELRGIVELIRGKYDPDGDVAMPSLDNITRWESTYEMVCTLKEFLMHYKLEFKIEWEFVEPFIEALKPLVECSKQLQTEQYIIGDFYRDWLLCEAKLRKMKHNNNAIKLLTVMLDAHQKILYNEAFNAALYLDPRFNYLDSPYFRDDRKKQAVDHILRTDTAAQDMKTGTATVATTNECEIVNETITSLWTEDPYNILEEELHSMSKNTSSAQENLSLRQKLANLTYTHRQPFATNILEYWKNHPIKDPDVHNTLQIILAVSTNQASMERAHSALSTVLTKQKSNLSQTNLMNILLVKLNGSVLTDIDP